MIVDIEQGGSAAFANRVFDVCIVGTGPAGITIARRVAQKGGSVALLEAGGLELDTRSQDFYQGEIVGRDYFPLDATRLRYYGGSSNHWGGWARPLDTRDFEANPLNPMSGWPISKKELAPYADETADILELNEAPDAPLDFFDGKKLPVRPIYFRFSPPVRFGAKYKEELTESQQIVTALNANLIDLTLDDNSRAATSATFRGYSDPRLFQVRAKHFVIALGGLENPRFLLNATRQRQAGIGNEHDLVGRYFMDHLHVAVGPMVLRRPTPNMLVYTPTREMMASERILNFAVHLTPVFPPAPDSEAAKKIDPACNDPTTDLVAAEMAGKPLTCPNRTGDVLLVAEQSLNPGSRVMLDSQADQFGLRHMALEWAMTDLDFRTIRTAVVKMASLMATLDVGRMKLADWLLKGDPQPKLSLDDLQGENHHMGTTRMSSDPKTGVVNGDCRLHSVENVYMGGSSVFATSGHANPTFTIVQLALRLGDHLNQVLGRA